ncbi:hypothetical protein FisN_15Lh318 [Fistulifera solaris]|uniref:Protein YIPF n=1 Tax=Fistulifera solaris TaxID=1519565 RepID=A0A1Z5JWK4_FISSO|nr:hypothetical protein FisN_15Lh318 [Fistulifera solaris]|eukprot:GAX18387.1 hypothetical protein FisN_15Lh318 [Fistulifera solaris]
MAQSSGAAPEWTTAANDAGYNSSGIPATTVEQHQDELFAPYSTLDEPVMETIMRDVRAVGAKLKVVMRPMDRAPIFYAAVDTADSNANANPDHIEEMSENDRLIMQQLKDWDLWGPLVLCLALGICLSFRAPSEQASLVFAAVFCGVWVGGTIVTINAQLLGSTISFFQSLCVLGYSIFPMVLVAAVMVIIRWAWVDLIMVAVGFLWSTRTSTFFISQYIKPERRLLALYPVYFFFTFLAWIVFYF